MKMAGAKKVHYDSGPNMTPLVDVVMVILIFLMLAGSFGGTTQFLMSKQGIHAKGSGGHPDPSKVIETPIDIHISPAKAGIGFVAEGVGIQATNSPTNLEAALEKKLAAFTGNGTPVDQLQVVLYPTKNVKYTDLIQIYQAALDAKFTKVAFAATH
jgi:biopolymer transport protein ExbD